MYKLGRERVRIIFLVFGFFRLISDLKGGIRCGRRKDFVMRNF